MRPSALAVNLHGYKTLALCTATVYSVSMKNDTRQAEYTELTAACGETIYVRLEADPIKAAEMIVAFTSENCARLACPATQPRQSTRNILWADVNRSR